MVADGEIHLPQGCPRGREDCDPLSRISSGGFVSFICCGTNDGSTRELEQDRFRLCQKNEWTDEMSDCDHRDLVDLVAVVAGALSVDANIDPEQPDEPCS